jgi:tetratricopeptide (TPR) repeat protein
VGYFRIGFIRQNSEHIDHEGNRYMPTKRKTITPKQPTSLPNGVVFEPWKVVLLASFLIGIGTLLGWFSHAAIAPRQAFAPHQFAQQPVDNQEIQALTAHIEEAEAELLIDPLNAATQIHLGNLYYDLGSARNNSGNAQGAHSDWKRAIRHYEQARSSGGASPDVLTDLGTMYFRTDQPENAVAAYEEAISADPRHLNAWMNMGVAKRQSLGDNEGATAAWKRYLEIDPNSADASRVRTWLQQMGAEFPD